MVDLHLVLDRDGEILLLQRQNTGYMDGCYHLPAGHLEAGEDVLTGMAREAAEEVTIAVDSTDLVLVHTMHHNSAGNDRIALFFRCWKWKGDPANGEPEKCGRLAWAAIGKLPEDMVPYAAHALRAIAHGERFSSYGWES